MPAKSKKTECALNGGWHRLGGRKMEKNSWHKTNLLTIRVRSFRIHICRELVSIIMIIRRLRCQTEHRVTVEELLFGQVPVPANRVIHQCGLGHVTRIRWMRIPSWPGHRIVSHRMLSKYRDLLVAANKSPRHVQHYTNKPNG